MRFVCVQVEEMLLYPPSLLPQIPFLSGRVGLSCSSREFNSFPSCSVWIATKARPVCHKHAAGPGFTISDL